MRMRSGHIVLALTAIAATAGNHQAFAHSGGFGSDAVESRPEPPMERADLAVGGGDVKNEACATTNNLDQATDDEPIAQAAAGDRTGDAEDANDSERSDTLQHDGAWSQWIRTLVVWPEMVDFFSGVSDTLGQHAPWSWWTHYRAFVAETVGVSGVSDIIGQQAPSSWWTLPLVLCALLTASWLLGELLRGGVQHDLVAGLMRKLRRLEVRRRDVSVLNSELLADETRLAHLRDKITAMTRSLPMRGALLGIPLSTGGLSKLVQIPYDIAIAIKRRRLRTEFKRVRFGAANKYYCAGGDRDPRVCKLPPGLLMTKAEWKSSQTSLINKIKEAAERLKHEHANYKNVNEWLELVVDGEVYCPIEAAAEALGVDAVQSAVQEWAMDVALDIAVAVVF